MIGGLLAVAAMACGCSQRPDELALAAMEDSGLRLAARNSRPLDLAAADQRAAGAPVVRSDTLGADPTWFALGLALAQEAREAADEAAGEAATKPTTRPADARGYVHWRRRHGPAYPGDFWPSFGQWWKELPATLWDDTVATVTNPVSLAGIVAAGVSGIVINASGADNRVSDHYDKHGPALEKSWDLVGDIGGNPGTHFAVAGAMYLTSLARMDKENYEKASTLINALAINGLVTLALKGATGTRSPNRDPFGWPSGHTSSTFCFATVIYEEYGPWVGLPLFAFAGFVGYERIDARNHDFSDVISGALLGMAIGHAVAQNHQPRVMGFDVMPYVDPSRNAVGLVFSKSW